MQMQQISIKYTYYYTKTSSRKNYERKWANQCQSRQNEKRRSFENNSTQVDSKEIELEGWKWLRYYEHDTKI